MAFADTARLVADLDLDDSGFHRGATRAQRDLRNMGRQIDSTTRKMSRMQRIQSRLGGAGSALGFGFAAGGAMAAVQLGVQVAGRLVDVMGDAVRMAAEEDAAMRRLSNTIAENTEAWDGNYQAVEDLIAQRQRLAYSDGEQRDALVQLTVAMEDYHDAAAILPSVMDLARGAGMDLATAARLTAQGLAGNFGVFSRYGIIVERTGDNMADLQTVFDKYAGSAVAYANSDAGKMERAQIAINDAMESFGRMLTPIVGALAELATEIIPKVDQQFQDWADTIGQVEDVLTNVVAFIEEKMPGIPDAVGEALGTAWDWMPFNLPGTISEVIAEQAGQHGFAAEDFARFLGIDTGVAEEVRQAAEEEAKKIGAQAAEGIDAGLEEGAAGAGGGGIFAGLSATFDPVEMTRDLARQLKEANRRIDQVIADPTLIEGPLTKIRRRFRGLIKRLPAIQGMGGQAGSLLEQFLYGNVRDVLDAQGEIVGNAESLGIDIKENLLSGAGLQDDAIASIFGEQTSWETAAQNAALWAAIGWSDSFVQAAMARVDEIVSQHLGGMAGATPWQHRGGGRTGHSVRSSRTGANAITVSARDTVGGGAKVTNTRRKVTD